MRIRLDIPLLSKEISDGISDFEIRYVSTDTRTLCGGDLFIPLVGKKYDGGNFTEEAKGRGAIVIEGLSGTASLLRLAAVYKSKLARLKYTVGITGSVGKTTAKEFIYKIAKESLYTHKTEENENNIVGVAKTVLSAPKDTECLVLEIGTNHSGEIGEIVEQIPLDIALITLIGTSHIGNFGSRMAIMQEKLSICKNKKTRLITRLEDKISCIFSKKFSVESKHSDLYLERHKSGVLVYICGKPLFLSECVFSEKYLLEELCGAISVCLEMGIPIEAIKRGVSSLSYDNTRQKIVNVGKFNIYSDCYNASLESFSASFEAISRMKEYSSYSLVFGDIDELWDFGEAIHRELGRLISTYRFRNIYALGNMTKAVTFELRERNTESRIFDFGANADFCKVAKTITDNSLENEIILFKASRKMQLELLIEEIKRRCKA